MFQSGTLLSELPAGENAAVIFPYLFCDGLCSLHNLRCDLGFGDKVSICAYNMHYYGYLQNLWRGGIPCFFLQIFAFLFLGPSCIWPGRGFPALAFQGYLKKHPAGHLPCRFWLQHVFCILLILFGTKSTTKLWRQKGGKFSS